MHAHRRDYFEYERQVAQHLGSLLGPRERFRRVADLGCGYGGCLEYFVGEGLAEAGVGIDYDEAMIEAGRKKLSARGGIELVHENIFSYQPTELFDLVLLRDVVEHVPDLHSVLRKVSKILAPGGLRVLSFAPFASPFGGHQHCLRGWVSRVPFAQVLPLGYLLRFTASSAYKQGEELAEDLRQVFATRLSVRKFESTLKGFPLEIEKKQAYLFRPEYRAKYGLPPLRNASWPGWQEFTSTGVYYVLRRL